MQYLTIYRDGALGLFRHLPEDAETLDEMFGAQTSIYRINDLKISVNYLTNWLVNKMDTKHIKLIHITP